MLGRSDRVTYPKLSNDELQDLQELQDGFEDSSPEFLDTLADWARARAVQNRIVDGT